MACGRGVVYPEACVLMTSIWRGLRGNTSTRASLLSSELQANICRPSGTQAFLPRSPGAEALGYDPPSLRDCVICAVVGAARGLKSPRRMENRALFGTAKAAPLENAAESNAKPEAADSECGSGLHRTEARLNSSDGPANAALKRGRATTRAAVGTTRVVGTLLVWLAVCGSLFAAASGSPAVRRQQARTQFETAERMREALNGRPESERTRRDYQKVADAYRKVYYVSPASTKADASVVAVAEILAEMGRHFSPDDKDLHAAIGQYEFLRREYPGSKYRVEALFTIGQIYKEDLNDEAAARATFEEFLKRYPHVQLAAKAQEALAELNQPKAKKKVEVAAQSDGAPAPSETQVSAAKKATLSRVTGIRHWSTADYTRVAIDLDAEVKYQAGRVPDPDRIFFDLPDTRLASTLVGKSFDVQDGFLKKIRVAQYQVGATRVVLEVDDVAEYSAFLLPNPYRLIIDIHGRAPHVQTEIAAGPPAGVAADEYAAKAAPAVTASNGASAGGAPKSGNQQIAGSMDSGASGSIAKQEQKAVAPVVVKAQPRTTKTTGDGVTPPTEIATAVGSTAKPSTKAPPTAAVKTAPASTPLSEPAAEDTGSVRAATSKSSPKTATIAARKSAPDADDEDLPSPGGAGGKTSAKATAAPTAVTVAPDKKSRSSKKTVAASAIEAPTIHEASPTADGDRSLIRALGLKIGRIVIDAGHGGHDTGTIGPNGLLEKDLVLDVALRLGKLLESRLGADVIYTRDDDTFIPLETRTAIANEHQADLFISVHANSSQDASARGVETYYLNFTSNPEALEVAARENAVSEKSIHELQDLVKKITLKEKIEESRELASDVQLSLYTGLSAKNPTLRNRGVKKAPFVVLIGANMPSILAEISFVSNPTDEKKLETPEYRQKIAESLYKGIAKYAGGLSGVKVAAKFNKEAGQ